MVENVIQGKNGITISVSVTAVTYNENVDMPETASISSIDKNKFICFICYSICNRMFTIVNSHCCKIFCELWINNAMFLIILVN